MNFKDFKKVDVTKTHTIFKHPSGHTIEIAHNSLTPEQKKQMRDIPIQTAKERLREQREIKKLANGTPKGPIESDETPSEEMTYSPLTAPITRTETDEEFEQRKMLDRAKSLLMPEAKSPVPSAEELKKYEQMEQQIAPKVPQGPTNIGLEKYMAPAEPSVEQAAMPKSAYEKELETKGQVFKDIATLQEKQAADEAANARKTASDLQELAVRSAKEKDRLNKMITDVNSAIMDGRIDPGRHIGSMSTVGRISTAIGLILGGMGAGLTGGQNLAYKSLESAIDRDIEAQKMDLNKKNNLLTVYYRMYGDVQQAELAAKSQMLAMSQLKAQEIASRSRSAQAAQNSQLVQAQLATEQERVQNELLQRRADQQLSAMTKAPGASMPSEEQIFSYIDRKSLPDKAKQDTKDAYTDYQAAMQGISDLRKIMSDQHVLSTLEGFKSPVQRLELLKTYKVALAPVVKAVTGETRMSDQEFENFVQPLLSGPLTSKETLDKKIDLMIQSKMQDFKKYTTKLKGVGLSMPMPIIGQSVPSLQRK